MLREFADERIEVTGQKEDEIPVKDLYNVYADYCMEYKGEPVSQNKMIEWVDSHLTGCVRKRVHHTGVNPVSAYVGMRWVHGF